MPDTSGPAFPIHGGYGADIDDPRNRILGGGLGALIAALRE